MTMKSTKPYLLEAMYRWMVDSQCSPLLHARTDILGVNIPEGYARDNLIILDVSLCDITSKNIFVLKLTEDKVHYIPLWHNEMTIDEEIRIKCIRELPSHIHIDEQNNIHFYDKKEVSKLLNREKIELTIGKLTFSLYVSDLKVKKYQKIELKSCGIPRINKQDLYDISKLGHVYYYLELC